MLWPYYENLDEGCRLCLSVSFRAKTFHFFYLVKHCQTHYIFRYGYYRFLSTNKEGVVTGIVEIFCD